MHTFLAVCARNKKPYLRRKFTCLVVFIGFAASLKLVGALVPLLCWLALVRGNR